MLSNPITIPSRTLRVLDQDNGDDPDNNIIAQTISPTQLTTNTFPPFNDKAGDDKDGLFNGNQGLLSFGVVSMAIIVVIVGFVGWRFIKYWRLRRERQILQLQSSRADAVLGDMQVRNFVWITIGRFLVLFTPISLFRSSHTFFRWYQMMSMMTMIQNCYRHKRTGRWEG